MSVSFTLSPKPSFFIKILRLVQVSPDVSSSVPLISSCDFTIIIIFSYVFFNNGLFSIIGRSANTHPTGKVFLIQQLYCDVCAGLFSAADRCFPRARPQPPRKQKPLPVGSSAGTALTHPTKKP